jgi:hypothetical protein
LGLRSLNAAFPCWSCLSYFLATAMFPPTLTYWLDPGNEINIGSYEKSLLKTMIHKKWNKKNKIKIEMNSNEPMQFF